MTWRIFITLSCLCLCSITMMAQSDPALSTTGDEVVVTGTRYPKPLENTSTKVTVIDSATISRNFDLGQLLNEQAGIVINGAYSAPGKDRSIFLRNGGNQYTLILLDGQPLLDPSSLGGAVDLRLFDLQNIERIEIVRGAQSLIYGSDAVAGVINLISKQRDAEGYQLDLLASAGTYGTYEGGANVTGRAGNISYRLGGNIFSSDGISEAALPNNVDGIPERDAARRTSADAGLTYRPNEHWSISPSLRFATFDGDYDNGAFQDADGNTYDNELVNPAVAVAYSKLDYQAGFNYNFVATDRLFTSGFGAFDFEGRAHQADAFATKKWDNLALTLGAQLRGEKIGLDMPADGGDDNVTTISPYLQASYEIGKNSFAEGGIRYNDHSVFGSQFNYSVGIVSRLFRGVTVRGNVASAFQSPSLDQLYGPFGANADLQPQTSQSFELSIRYDSPNTGNYISLTGFERTIKDAIIFANPGYLNQDELEDLGAEIEGRLRISDALTLSSNFTYIESQLRSVDANGNPTISEDFFRRPRISAFAGVTYTPTFPLTARLTGNYTGERPDIFFDSNFNQVTVDLDPYLLVNLYVEYKLLKEKNLTLFVDMRNITNTDFVEVTGFLTQNFTHRTGVRFSVK